MIMCGLFTTIFGSDFIVASIILLFGEVLYMVVFRLFSLAELKEAFREILTQQVEEDDYAKNTRITQLLKAKTFKKEAGIKNLSEKHKIVLKNAYLHPYEKYYKQENAKRQLNIFLKKEIKQRVEKAE